MAHVRILEPSSSISVCECFLCDVCFPHPAVDSDSECEQGARAAEGSRPPWRSVLIGEQEHRIDMTSIEPYKRVVSHGGS